MKVPGSENFTYGTFAPRSKSAWEWKFQLPCQVILPMQVIIRLSAFLSFFLSPPFLFSLLLFNSQGCFPLLSFS